MEIPRHWRLKQQRYSLVGEVCPHCNHKTFPPRAICPNCGQEAVTRQRNEASSEREVLVYDYKLSPSMVVRR